MAKKKSAPAQPRGKAELVQAVKRGDVEHVAKLVDGAGKATRHELLAQGLTVGCEQKQYDVVERLTSLGGNPSAAFANKPVPLLVAVDLDDARLVKHLLECDKYHADIKIRESIRRNCIIAARSRAVAQLIFDQGLSVNDSLGKESKSLLMDVRTPAVVELLLDRGARLEDRDNQGRTALMTSLEYDEEPEAIAKVLIARGADIEARDNTGRSILNTTIWKSRLVVLKLLIQKGVNVNARDSRGRNALHHLASDKRRNYYDYKPSRQTGRKKTQQDRDQEIVDLLFKSKIDVTARDVHDRTCIHWAAGVGNSGLLKLLLRTGRFDVNAIEHRKKTPLHLAAAASHVNTQTSLPNGAMNAVLVLLDHGASVTSQSDGDWTPLHVACWNKSDSRETVGILLRHTLGEGRHQKTRNGMTALHIAAHSGNIRVVEYLLKRMDVKRSLRDIFGNTPLLYAAAQPQSSPKERSHRNALMNKFASWNNTGALSNEAKEAAKLFQATIVDFYGPKKDGTTRSSGHTPKRVSVFDLLYDPKQAKNFISTKGMAEKEAFRWIHLPSNNVSW
jgi:ankyrin repeat protein